MSHTITANAPTATATPSANPARVLAVEDDPVSRRVLELHLKRLGHEVLLVSDVASAKHLFGAGARHCYDCVITDFRMPGETGLALLDWLRGEDPTLAAIVLTATGERQTVLDALRAGACDFIEKPYRQVDLAAAVDTAVGTTRQRRRHLSAEAETMAVGQMQRRLLQSSSGTLANGVSFSHHPRHNAGGDFFNVFPLDSERLLILLADVSGHDLQAAFVSAYFQGIARGMLEKKADVGEILGFFNRYLAREWNAVSDSGPLTISLAVCATVVNRATGRITVFSAGAPAPLVIGFEQAVPSPAEGGGNPLGWFDDSEPTVSEFALPTTAGMLLWTDGLDDHASDLGVSPYSLAYRLLLAGRTAKADCRLAEAKDDILAVRVGLRPGKPVAFHTLLHDHYRGDQVVEIDPLQLRWKRSLQLAIPELPADRLDEILLCLREACLNALLHGCQRSAALNAEVSLAYEPGAKRLHVSISDPGPGHAFDWERHVERAVDELLDEHRGLSLIHGFASSVRTERNGAHLRLTFDLNPPKNSPSTP
jgi:sigma-B regulation protein RsbU (phosphoserine phosphatase)